MDGEQRFLHQILDFVWNLHQAPSEKRSQMRRKRLQKHLVRLHITFQTLQEATAQPNFAAS